MKDSSVVFLDSLREIGVLLGQQDIESAFKTSSGLTLFGYLMEYPEGVFISEVLEGVFSQVGPVIDTYQIPDEELTDTMERLQTAYNELVASVEANDKMGILNSLIKLRYSATQFQLKWSRIGKSKPSKVPQIPPQIGAMMKDLLS